MQARGAGLPQSTPDPGQHQPAGARTADRVANRAPAPLRPGRRPRRSPRDPYRELNAAHAARQRCLQVPSPCGTRCARRHQARSVHPAAVRGGRADRCDRERHRPHAVGRRRERQFIAPARTLRSGGGAVQPDEHERPGDLAARPVPAGQTSTMSRGWPRSTRRPYGRWPASRSISSKDNVQFGLRAVDNAGNRSPVAFPVVAA